MKIMKSREQVVSFVAVIALAVVLPGILRLANSTMRLLVGAEGRLAAVSVETNRVLGPLSSPWQALAQGGDQLGTFLDGNTQKVGTLRPKYIRIDHIYDQFDVVGRDGNGITYNWTKLDELVKKIVETGAVPFFSLSYMPVELSSDDVTAPPKEWNEWATLVQKTIEHYSGEMGLVNVYYEVWNEPDLFGKWTMGGKKDYRTLYLHSSLGAARAAGVKPFKLGGPGTTGLYKAWMDGFFPYVLQNKLRLDFFSWHRYDMNMDVYTKDVDDVNMWLESQPYFANVEKIVSEFGPSSERGGENNTKTGAAHLVAVMRQLLFKIQYGFTFSVAGDWGILGTPRETALTMLNKLGDQRLAISGEGSWVQAIGAKNGNVYQVLLTNYDPKGAHSEVVPVTFMNLSTNQFTLRKTFLVGGTSTETVATTSAILQREIPMTPNSVVLVELEPKTN